MNISAYEKYSFLRASVKNGQILQFFELYGRSLKQDFRKWRWKNGISLRGHTPAPTEDAMPVAADHICDFERIKSQAEEFFQVQLPQCSPKGNQTFRAAGAQRKSWPEGTVCFNDIQNIHAWHRLYWALELSGPQLNTRLSRWLNSPTDLHSSHPYAVSERIAVITQILGTYTLSHDLSRKLVSQLKADADWLTEKIEYRLGIHNHLLNNARALWCAGMLFKGESQANNWINTARSIWDEFWPQLILEDGIFSEQSSHYHVLLTRTLLTYYFDAVMSNRKLSDETVQKAEKMCHVTNILIRSDGSIPLFGDISPDLPTSWLRGLSVVCQRSGLLNTLPRDKFDGYAAGANSFFKSRYDRSIPLDDSKSRKDNDDWNSDFFPNGGLLFARHNKYNLELIAHGDPGLHGAGHGDTGRGSFEIWMKGHRVVVDGGVPTYLMDDKCKEFRGYKGQNGIAINGIAPSLLHYEATDLPDWYCSKGQRGHWTENESSATFTWYGFMRHQEGLTWNRTWTWSENRINIIDSITGWAGKASVEGIVHFGENGWQLISPNHVRNSYSDLTVKASSNFNLSLDPLCHSSDYGILKTEQGLLLKMDHVQLPVSITWAFEFKID